MTIMNSLVKYDKFEIVKSLEYCSLVEYVTIYGIKKVAIILNDINRIVFNINKNPYLVYNIDAFEDQIFQEQNEKFKNLKTSENIKLIGDYKLSNNEFIINLPYALRVDVKHRSSQMIKHFSLVSYSLTKGFVNPLAIILNETNTQIRMKELQFKTVHINNDDIILYDAKHLSQFYLSKAKDKQAYYRETYEILMEKYYQEKELKQKQKEERKTKEESKDKVISPKKLRENEKVEKRILKINISTENELRRRKKSEERRRLREERKLKKVQNEINILDKDGGNEEEITLPNTLKDIKLINKNNQVDIPIIQSQIEKEDIKVVDVSIDNTSNINNEISIKDKDNLTVRGNLEPKVIYCD